VVLAVNEENNTTNTLLRQRLAAQDAAIAAATSLADLRTRWANTVANKSMPQDRTPQQAKAAIANKLNSGGAD
jgi:hypothetical protein